MTKKGTAASEAMNMSEAVLDGSSYCQHQSSPKYQTLLICSNTDFYWRSLLTLPAVHTIITAHMAQPGLI